MLRPKSSVRPLAASIGLLLCAHAASAATLFWDGGTTNIVTAGDGVSAGGAGIWNTSLLNWDNGTAHVAWPNLTADIATFGGTAGTVTLGTAGAAGGTVNVGGLVFLTSAYLIGDSASNGTLNFGSTQGTITANGIATPLNGVVTINSKFTGTAGLAITGSGGTSGSGFVRLTGDNRGLSGGISITAGAVTASGPFAFGSNQIAISNGATLLATGALTVNNNIALGSGGANLRAYSTGSLTLNGVISDGVAAAPLSIVDTGVVRLNGVNTYTGVTNINSGTVVFNNIGDTTNGGNLGKGGDIAFVSQNTGIVPILRYTGGSFATNRKLTTAGGIANASAALEITDAGANVSFSSFAGAAQKYLTKSGQGTLTLTGTADNNNGRVKVDAGTLVLDKASSGSVHALGSQGNTDYALIVNGGTAQLGGSGGDQLFNNSSVQMLSGTFDFNGRSEAIDGLIGTGGVVTNNSLTDSTITVGSNNNNGGAAVNNFSGVIRDGSGIIGLTKVGNGTQTLSGANTYTGSTVIAAGTLRLGTGGSLGAGSIFNNATLEVATATQTTLTGVGGSGGLNMTGSGTLTLAGAHFYAGNTSVTNGTLNLTGTVDSLVTVAAGGTITGSGSATSEITLNDGATVIGGPNAVTGAGINALGMVNVLIPGGTLGSNVADVIKYGFGLAPSTASFNTAGYRSAVVTDDTLNQKITLSYTAQAKVWNPAVTSWDTGVSTTWTGGDGIFLTGDTVTFGDLTADATVGISGSVAPSAVTVSNTAAGTTLTINGSGSITGFGGLVKTGNGTLQLNTANTYKGQTLISGGIVKVGNNLALGVAGEGNETIINGGTLDVANATVNTTSLLETIKIAGTGVGGNGAIINSGALDQNNALTFVTLTANASIGGTGRYDFRNNGGAVPVLDLAGFKLTKVGTNVISLQNGVLTGGDIEINAGQFRVEGSTIATGSGTITVNPNGTFSVYGNVGGFNRTVVFNPSTGTTGPKLENSGAAVAAIGSIASNIIINGASDLASTASAQLAASTGGITTTLTGNISGTGSFRKTGAGAFVFTGNNTYGGYTLIDAGTLRVGSATAIPATTSVILYSTSSPMFDINGYNVTVASLTSGGTGDTGAVVHLGLGGGKLTVTAASDVLGITDSTGSYHGRIYGTGDLEYNNATNPTGVWNLTNANNDFVGNVTITSGRLRYAAVNGAVDSTALGSLENDLIFNGTPVNDLNQASGSASFQVSNGATGFVANLNTERSVTLNSGKEGTFYVWGGSTMNVRGVIGGGGILRKEDTGLLALHNTGNNYTGETRIVNGTLQLGAAGVIPDASVVRLGNGAALLPILDLNGNSETVGGLTSVQLSDSSLKTNGTVTSATAATFTINNAVDQNFGGKITGSVAVTKFGSATQTLSGANTYTGATTINQGVLSVTGTISGSAVTVNSTGTLGGTGVVTGAVTVNANGTLAPGAGGIGALSTSGASGTVTFNNSSNFALEIGATTSDSVNVSNVLALTGNINLAISLLSQPVESTNFTIFNVTTGITGYAGGARFSYGGNALDEGEFFGVIDGSLGQAFTISYAGGDGNDVVLTAVPEPGSVAMLVGGLGCLLGLRRPRRRA